MTGRRVKLPSQGPKFSFLNLGGRWLEATTRQRAGWSQVRAAPHRSGMPLSSRLGGSHDAVDRRRRGNLRKRFRRPFVVAIVAASATSPPTCDTAAAIAIRISGAAISQRGQHGAARHAGRRRCRLRADLPAELGAAGRDASARAAAAFLKREGPRYAPDAVTCRRR